MYLPACLFADSISIQQRQVELDWNMLSLTVWYFCSVCVLHCTFTIFRNLILNLTQIYSILPWDRGILDIYMRQSSYEVTVNKYISHWKVNCGHCKLSVFISGGLLYNGCYVTAGAHCIYIETSNNRCYDRNEGIIYYKFITVCIANSTVEGCIFIAKTWTISFLLIFLLTM